MSPTKDSIYMRECEIAISTALAVACRNSFTANGKALHCTVLQYVNLNCMN
jgi:hypothetical protein